MAIKDKNILMNAITIKLAEENKRRNAELCKQNLYSEQKAFDHGEMLISLAFMPDDEFNKIVAMVL